MEDSGQLIKVIREISILKRLNNLPNGKNFVTELYEVKLIKEEQKKQYIDKVRLKFYEEMIKTQNEMLYKAVD